MAVFLHVCLNPNYVLPLHGVTRRFLKIAVSFGQQTRQVHWLAFLAELCVVVGFLFVYLFVFRLDNILHAFFIFLFFYFCFVATVEVF